MPSKFKTNLARRDPDKVERMRAVLDPLFDQCLAEISALVNEPVPEEEIQLRDPRAGEKFVDAHRRKLAATAQKKRTIAEHLSLVERILDLTGRDIKAEQDQAEEETNSEKELLVRMLAQVRTNHPDTAKQIEEETGGEFEFVAPRNRE